MRLIMPVGVDSPDVRASSGAPTGRRPLHCLVDAVDIQCAQSSVFSPSDFYFPHDAIISESVPNTEMLMFADVDLEKLKLLHREGSVTNLRDRRDDLYSLDWKNKG